MAEIIIAICASLLQYHQFITIIVTIDVVTIVQDLPQPQVHPDQVNANLAIDERVFIDLQDIPSHPLVHPT